MEQLIGRRLGDCEIVEQIGQDSLACLYKARQPALDRWVTVKVLPVPDLRPDLTELFQEKSRLLAHLEHPHILPLYAFRVEPPYHYLIMPYLPHALTLSSLMDQRNNPEPLLSYLIQVAEAADYAHRRGVVHQAINPASILIDNHQALLSDFSLGFNPRPSPTTGNFSHWIYLAPEQRRGGPVDHRADIYALGVILYQILTNSLLPPPAGGFNYIPELLPHLPPLTAKRLLYVTIRALVVEPGQRYASAAEFAQALGWAWNAQWVKAG